MHAVGTTHTPAGQTHENAVVLLVGLLLLRHDAVCVSVAVMLVGEGTAGLSRGKLAPVVQTAQEP